MTAAREVSDESSDEAEDNLDIVNTPVGASAQICPSLRQKKPNFGATWVSSRWVVEICSDMGNAQSDRFSDSIPDRFLIISDNHVFGDNTSVFKIDDDNIKIISWRSPPL